MCVCVWLRESQEKKLFSGSYSPYSTKMYHLYFNETVILHTLSDNGLEPAWGRKQHPSQILWPVNRSKFLANCIFGNATVNRCREWEWARRGGRNVKRDYMDAMHYDFVAILMNYCLLEIIYIILCCRRNRARGACVCECIIHVCKCRHFKYRTPRT